MLAATEYSLTNRRSFGRADSTLSRASLVAQYQNSVPREKRGGTTRVSINLTSNPPTRRTVLQIKPACTPLIEQNFDTGLTRNSAPRVTKHRVNMIVLSSPPSLSICYGIPRGEGVMYLWNIKSILLLFFFFTLFWILEEKFGIWDFARKMWLFCEYCISILELGFFSLTAASLEIFCFLLSHC